MCLCSEYQSGCALLDCGKSWDSRVFEVKFSFDQFFDEFDELYYYMEGSAERSEDVHNVCKDFGAFLYNDFLRIEYIVGNK